MKKGIKLASISAAGISLAASTWLLREEILQKIGGKENEKMNMQVLQENSLLLFGVLILCGAIAWFFFSRRTKQKTIFPRATKKAELEAKLLNMVFGNREAVKRLIAYERNRNPGGSEEDHIQSAIERMINDRR